MNDRVIAGAAVLGVSALLLVAASRGVEASEPIEHDAALAGFTKQELAAEADGICHRYHDLVGRSYLELRDQAARVRFEQSSARSEVRQLRSLIAAADTAAGWRRFLRAKDAEAEAMRRFDAAGLDGEPTVLWMEEGRYYLAQAATGEAAAQLEMKDCAVTVHRHDDGSPAEPNIALALGHICGRARAAFDQLPDADDPDQLPDFVQDGRPVFDQFVRDLTWQMDATNGFSSMSRFVELHQRIWTSLNTKATALQAADSSTLNDTRVYLARTQHELRDTERALGLTHGCHAFDQTRPGVVSFE